MQIKTIAPRLDHHSPTAPEQEAPDSPASELAAINGQISSSISGLVASVRAAMNLAAAKSPLSRAQIIDRMNALAQAAGVRLTSGNVKSISEDTLIKWLSPNAREHTPSLLAVNVFCLAVEDCSPLAAQLAVHGCAVMSAEDRRYRDYGRACARAREAARVKQEMEAELPVGIPQSRRWWDIPTAVHDCLASLGLTVTGLARSLGVSPELVAAVANGQAEAPEVRTRLLKLGVPEDVLPLPGRAA